MSTQNPKKLKMSRGTIKDMLETCGFAIIRNVLTPEEIIEATDLMIGWEKGIPGLSEIHSDLHPHGIYKFHGVGHAPHAWYIRTRPKVQQVFKDLWDTDDLISSFDGSCYMPKSLAKKDTKKGWTHVDQSPKASGNLMCYQGLVSLTDNKERTLVVYEGSNNLYNQYCVDRELKGTKHWEKIDPAYLESIADSRRVLTIPAGSIALWDSRTFHQNQYGVTSDTDDNNTVWSEERRVQYVCFLPRNHKDHTEKVHEKRLKAFHAKRTTSHWPCPQYLNGLQPNTWGDETKKIDYEKLPDHNLDYLMSDIIKII